MQSSKNNIAPHGSRCAGYSFALGVFRGLFFCLTYLPF
nr:MAG TPA: hypothetical protein [Caudoviricetes sp.]